MSESRVNEGLGTGLSKLPKFDKSSFMASYVKQQQRNTNVYEVEGKRYLQTWGKDDRKSGSSTVGSGISEVLEGDVRRKAKVKEKENGRARAGIDTPVLKPRNPELRGREVVIEKSRSRTSGKENRGPDEARKAAGASKASEVGKGKETKKKASTSKEMAWVKSTKASKEGESDSGDDTATRDRERRMNARKERRREKLEIVNPKKRKGSPERHSEDDSSSNGKASKKKKGTKSKKQKIPAGLALMHGFSATNVGKARLTMDPTARPTGVFSKGKASSKTPTTKKATAGTGFSELAFLNKRQARKRHGSPESRHAKARDQEKAPTKQSEKKATSKIRKRLKEPTPEPSESEETASSSSSESEEEEVQERPKRRPRSSSVTWDIERDSGRLASTDLSVEVPLAKSTKFNKAEPQQEHTVDEDDASKLGDGQKAWSSLGPHDSASQCVPRASSPRRHRPETNAFSKYFQQILDQEPVGQPGGRQVAQSIPCPTFIAKAPCPPPGEDKEPTAVHREGSGLSLWQTFHPNPPRNDVPLDDPTIDYAPEDEMDYEAWQEPAEPFRDGHGRYGFDSRHRANPSFIEDIGLFEEEVFDQEELLDYWEDSKQPLDRFVEHQYDFDMDEDGVVPRDMLSGDYDEAGFVADNQNLEMSLSAYNNDDFEELYTGHVANGFLEDYGDPEPVLMQWNQLDLAGSLQEETWQRMGEQDMEPDPLPLDDAHERAVDLSELGVSDSNNSTLQGLLSDGENVCQFLRGRSALLGFDVDMGVTMPQSLAVAEPTSTSSHPVPALPTSLFLARSSSRSFHQRRARSVPSPNMFHVKPEPTEARLPPLSPTNLNTARSNSSTDPAPLKSEPSQTNLRDFFTPRSNAPKPEPTEPEVPKYEEPQEQREEIEFGGAFQRPPPAQHKTFQSASEIDYAPEAALKEGLKMVNTIEASVKTLALGNLRKDVWEREIKSLKGQSTPTTLIAVCGATGAGKSSILNAILDDNIVPTSGMRACTAVVTEIAYHGKSTINGDVSFLSRGEWEQELGVLLHDLVDEEGKVKRTTDLKSDAGVAWSKVHAVYPNVEIERLVKMQVQDILNLDQNIVAILGTTKKIVAKTSKDFSKEIAKYIDSKDQKRGDKKDKKKDKAKEPSLMDKVRKAAGQSVIARRDGPKGEEAAYWPLIRQVTVRCPSKALSTGAILVDLPGVADANAARNNIAKDYMKKANCIWILAPITRAVDDKTARDLLGDAFKMQLMMDGNYDDHCITFIASKCDDISCSEVIGALGLHNDPELEPIEDRIDELQDQIKEKKRLKTEADKLLKTLEADLKDLRDHAEDYKDHLEALKAGETYESKFAKPAASKKSSGKKRKSTGKGRKGSPKRRRSAASGNEESDDDIDMDSDSDDDDSDAESKADSDSEADSDSDSEKSDAEDSDADSADEVAGELVEEETEESLETKLEAAKEGIKVFRQTIKETKTTKRDSSDKISTLQKQLAKAQKEKNAFCSLKRSEFSRDVLKEDFRTGLKDLDEAAAEERDPENFDPTQQLRDYAKIDLPVFTCSSRDYVRLKGQVKGDGEPSCFSNIKDTGIPELQQWCHQLTVASRERAARGYHAHISTFARSIQSYVQGIGDVTAFDRETLREKWESVGFLDQGLPDDDEDPFAQYLQNYPQAHALLNQYGGYDAHNPPEQKQKLDANGDHVGITPRLCKEFSALVDDCVEDLKRRIRDSLEDKCEQGVEEAIRTAVATSDQFASEMHWATYRATLKRHGSWRRDLNVEMVTPFTKSIAVQWGKLFESDLFAPFEAAITKSVKKLLQDFEASSAAGLKDRVKLQGQACLEEAQQTLQNMIANVQESMTTQQKEISRKMSPHVQRELIDGYELAMEERGKGSVARQKAVFRRYVDEHKEDIFEEGSEVILGGLDEASQAVGQALDASLESLAQKVEVNLSVLWEGMREDPAQIRARKYVVDAVSEIQTQLRFWSLAHQTKKEQDDVAKELALEDGDVEMGDD